jgi:Ca-activated chloride channel family protein
MIAEGKQRLADALQRIDPRGGIAMRNAIGRAWTSLCKDIKTHPDDRSIRIIVVLADGKGGYHGDPLLQDSGRRRRLRQQGRRRRPDRYHRGRGGETRKADCAEIREIFQRFGDLL